MSGHEVSCNRKFLPKESKTITPFSLPMNHELHEAILAICDGGGTRGPGAPDHQLIAGADPQEALPDFAGILWPSANKKAWSDASATFLQLAERLPVTAWPAMDQSIRSWVRCPGPRVLPTDTFSLQDIFRRLTGGAEAAFPSPAHILIALCHHSGKLREKALSFVDQLPPLLETCLLMVRANDWVRPIRAAATKAIPSSISHLEPKERLLLLPLAIHFRDCGRLDERDLPDTWVRLLSSTVNDDLWLEVWRSAPPKQQRLYLSLLDPEAKMPGLLLRMALIRSRNRLAITFHLTRIFPHLSGQEKEEVERIASTSRVASVVRIWMEHFLQHSPAEAIPRLVELLSSRSRSLRDFARFHLKRLSPMDFTQHYLHQLAEGSDSPTALAGLSETAPAVAHEVALERLSSPVPAIKKAAILALSPEWIEANLPWAFSPGAWDSPQSGKAIRMRLARIPRQLGPHVLENQEILEASPDIRSFLLNQVSCFSKWDGLEVLLLSPSAQLDPRFPHIFWKWAGTERSTYSHLPSDRKARLLELVMSYPFRNELAKRHWAARELKFLLESAE
ncbi:hypothetical protein OVA24_10885 [Luteolibacter sp. SL250]|uniref:hypothetical protein n=1 Tax=Luteolibacter sp. SL250 TaxID=2995170 RepID=UPI00227229DD|nr:hypothetical protein [Luteolibacter sp. SL250]WAC17747.1 hypothetical protein OVA24_10885 [Luteolibacter sp. SL250]